MICDGRCDGLSVARSQPELQVGGVTTVRDDGRVTTARRRRRGARGLSEEQSISKKSSPSRIPITFTAFNVITVTHFHHIHRIQSHRIHAFPSHSSHSTFVTCYHIRYDSIITVWHPRELRHLPPPQVWSRAEGSVGTLILSDALPLLEYDRARVSDYALCCRCGPRHVSYHAMSCHGMARQVTSDDARCCCKRGPRRDITSNGR